jgi:hypothetical protein
MHCVLEVWEGLRCVPLCTLDAVKVDAGEARERGGSALLAGGVGCFMRMTGANN